MATINRKLKMTDDDFRRDFEDSVIMEEISFDTIPAELMAEFEESMFSHRIAEDEQINIQTEWGQLRESDL